jgi:hypothetical protein
MVSEALFKYYEFLRDWLEFIVGSEYVGLSIKC